MNRKYLALALLAAAAATGAHAQSYPSRPVTLIVPFAAGGPADITGRIVAEALSRNFGQQFVVENVAGAGGTTGATRAARAAPDGYTLILGHMGTHAAARRALSHSRLQARRRFRADRARGRAT